MVSVLLLLVYYAGLSESNAQASAVMRRGAHRYQPIVGALTGRMPQVPPTLEMQGEKHASKQLSSMGSAMHSLARQPRTLARLRHFARTHENLALLLGFCNPTVLAT
jgi:hypothetical protein